jgi:hypothetical protein
LEPALIQRSVRGLRTVPGGQFISIEPKDYQRNLYKDG